MIETEQSVARKPWPDYRAVWRWHFYAGLFCVPFVTVLSISGAIYLFKPQVESWIDRHCDGLAIEGRPASAADQIRAALTAVPGSTLNAYEVPRDARASARVIVSQGGKATRVYVHPKTLKILKTVDEDARFMRVLFRLHGELLMGNRGSAVVELAASWAIIMIVTGLYLWWPRKAKTFGGIVYPRLGGGSRIFWRDLHGVTGFWISGLALFLLLTGLPWAKFWGDYFRNVRRITGTAVARQDWTNGNTSNAEIRPVGQAGEHGEHRARAGRGRDRGPTPSDLTAVDRIVATVQPLDLPAPVVIAPPARGSKDWTAKSTTPNRPLRVDLVVDGTTGAIKERKDFKDRHVIDRIVGTGIAAHEGQLFGWMNQLLGLATAIGLILLSVSSVVLWLRRREPGVLGAPGPAVSPRFSTGLFILVVLFGIYLPLFGASLIAVMIAEKTILCRIPRLRDWLGLQVRAPIAVTTGALS
ncbi:MAG: PepSY domain-containing protein [Isosphaeraceae bacterium]|nr:PepSY domain-containing protein [Isosphaeraceae bacterium]